MAAPTVTGGGDLGPQKVPPLPMVNFSEKRAAIAGPSGLKGLVSNKKTFLVGLFASLGGLVYGCE